MKQRVFLSTYTANEKGEIIFSDLKPGKYSFIKLTAVNDYILNTKDIEFDITKEYKLDQTKYEFTIENKSFAQVEVIDIVVKNKKNGIILDLSISGSDLSLVMLIMVVCSCSYLYYRKI